MIFLQVCSTEQVSPPSGQSSEYMLNSCRASLKHVVMQCVKKLMRSAMYLSSYHDICDIYHQNSMTEINSFDIYS